MASLWLAGSAPLGAQSDDVSSCSGCHWEIYEEWEASRHAAAWSDPVYQKELQTAENPDSCGPCHRPTRLFVKGPSVLPSARAQSQETGVNCITCHVDKDDVMHGPFGAESTGHFTLKDALFAREKAEALCLSCHGQSAVPEHSVAKAYLSRSGPLAEKSCIDCHMPDVTRQHASDPMEILEVPERAGRKHTFLGSHDRNMLASALSVRFQADGTIVVQNTGAGHAVPAGGTKALIIEMASFDASGKTLWRETTELRQAQQLLPGRSWRGKVPVSAGVDTMRVTLRYRYSDHQAPDEAQTIGVYKPSERK